MATISTQKIDQIRDRYSASLERIRSETTRSEAWRMAELAKVYIAIRSAVGKEQRRVDAASKDALRDAQHRVLGTGGLKGELGSLTISQRDAADRVAGVQSSHEALELLDRANRAGDEVLARAIAARALDSQWVEVANAFLEERPELDEPFNLLWAREHGSAATLQQDFYIQSAIEALRPAELAGLGDLQITRLARSVADDLDAVGSGGR